MNIFDFLTLSYIFFLFFKGKGFCLGDRGGPFVCNGVLTGVVSWGFGCSTTTEYPGVYANVAHFADWIEENAVYEPIIETTTTTSTTPHNSAGFIQLNFLVILFTVGLLSFY